MRIYPDDAIILAPLAGYTDLPYRRSCRRHGCAFAFTEMVDSGCLSRHSSRTRRYLERGSDAAGKHAPRVGGPGHPDVPAADAVGHDVSAAAVGRHRERAGVAFHLHAAVGLHVGRDGLVAVAHDET